MVEPSIAGPSQPSTLSAPQWRQFTFFDNEHVKDAEDPSQPPKYFRDATPPLVVTPTSPLSPLVSSIIVSSSSEITLLDRHFQPTKSWTAWDPKGRAIALVEAGGLLVGVGDDEKGFPVLKIWDLTRDEKKIKGGAPVLLRNVRIQHGSRRSMVTSIALTSNLSHLAIGLGDGTALLYRHLLQSLTTSPTALTTLPKPRVVHESPEPITGLGFRETSNSSGSGAKAPESDKGTAMLSLFIVTTNKILNVTVSGRVGETRTIDELGCGLGCAAMDWDRRDMVVARDEAIYLYGPEGRGACYAYEGPKSSIAIYKHNLLIVSPPFFPTAGSNSSTVRNYVKSDPTSTSSDIAKVTIFDLHNKLIGYSGTFREGVRHVFHQWGEIYVLGSESKLSRLDEQSTTAKLDVLYKRNLFTLAISLAKSQGIGEAGVREIHRRYGDYLYTKGDYDGAMGQFVKTLGFLQPSYVIRKFLDAQRIQNLTTYLQELHAAGLANPDHTTLLLNCYTKTSDRARLDAFIKAEVGRSGDADELPFDLDTAIRVCRQAGFFEHATYLAKKWGRHEDYLRIQIEDAQQYGDALRYLRSLGPEACEDNMVLYGRMLLQHEPEATTELLVDLCSGQLGKKEAIIPTADVETKTANGATGPAMLSYLGVNRVAGLFTGDAQPPASQSGDRAPQTNGVEKELVSGITEKNGLGADQPSYTPPSPRQYFAHFVDHREHFIKFLELVAATLWNQTIVHPLPSRNISKPLRPTELPHTEDPVVLDQRAVWNTLLELYLASAEKDEEQSTGPNPGKAMALLADREKPYDPVHAMVLCSTSRFTDGLVGLWESMGMYEDVLRFWIEKDKPLAANGASSTNEQADTSRHPSDEVLRCLDLYGPTNLHLYPLVLRYLTSSSAVLSRQSSHLPRILAIIDENRILPPLAVVQLLSRNGVASVGNVKDWLKTKVEEIRQDVESDKMLVESYRSETSEKEKELVQLADPTAPEVFQVTRCAACGTQLDLPSVHFMCKHSYHQRCLSDSEPECIICARQHSIVREVRRGQTRLADRHDLFLHEVHDADDGFAVVAGAFGRGIMSKKVTGQ